uniref:Uncharacterized protein n=1 Tax=Oryza glaberrima TaxID=4538 RepID=I1R095_ORYGL
AIVNTQESGTRMNQRYMEYIVQINGGQTSRPWLTNFEAQLCHRAPFFFGKVN